MRTKKIIGFCVIAILLFLPSEQLFSQNKNKITVLAGVEQLKDEFNYGLVFTGPQLQFQYQYCWDLSVVTLGYNLKIGLGVPFSRKMAAVNIDFSPIDFSCFARLHESEFHSLKAGLILSTNYYYQVYANLQNNHLFWFGEIGLSPAIQYEYRWKEQSVKFIVRNSVLGFVSRPTRNDPYFYSLKFSDFFVRPHENLQFGSFDKYNHTYLQIEYNPKISKKNVFGLGMEYISSYFNANFQYLNYSFSWKRIF